jgi:hypothetical protein
VVQGRELRQVPHRSPALADPPRGEAAGHRGLLRQAVTILRDVILGARRGRASARAGASRRTACGLRRGGARRDDRRRRHRQDAAGQGPARGGAQASAARRGAAAARGDPPGREHRPADRGAAVGDAPAQQRSCKTRDRAAAADQRARRAGGEDRAARDASATVAADRAERIATMHEAEMRRTRGPRDRAASSTSGSRSCRVWSTRPAPWPDLIADAGLQRAGREDGREHGSAGDLGRASPRCACCAAPRCAGADGRRSRPASDVPAAAPWAAPLFIGVTGTNGKTSTVWMIAAALRAAALRSCGSRRWASRSTTSPAARQALRGLPRRARRRRRGAAVATP